VNYTIAKGDQSLYLFSCTQTWQPRPSTRFLAVLRGAAEGASGDNSEQKEDETLANGPGKWSECPAFGIGVRYTLTVNNTSDAQLVDAAGSKPMKLEYLSSVVLSEPALRGNPTPPALQAANDGHERAKVHIASTPSGGEIYIDGKFFGNTPSDIMAAVGEHIVKITLGGKEWSRSIEITAGEISVQADLTGK
jgi:hypothetical protein